jgi:hypothetical protein
MLLDGPNWQLVFFGSERFASWRSFVPNYAEPRYGPFSAITDSADPANLLRTSRCQAKCEFSHGLCIIPVRQHSAFYGLDIGNRR